MGRELPTPRMVELLLPSGEYRYSLNLGRQLD
jgi:hypothetical protein